MFEYRAIITAITSLLNKGLPEDLSSRTIPTTPQMFRHYLVNKDTSEPKAVEIWRKQLGIIIEPFTWLVASNCTKETRLILLHFKILYGIYPTNKLLYKMGKTNSIYCTHCPNEVDTLEHFFYECKQIAVIWNLVQETIGIKTGIK